MQNDEVVHMTLKELEVVLNLIKKTPIDMGLYPLFIKLLEQRTKIIDATPVAVDVVDD
jgi:hypothetical protein